MQAKWAARKIKNRGGNLEELKTLMPNGKKPAPGSKLAGWSRGLVLMLADDEIIERDRNRNLWIAGKNLAIVMIAWEEIKLAAGAVIEKAVQVAGEVVPV